MAILFMSDCLFCKIVNKEIPAKIIYEDNNVLAFLDINPVAPFHCLVITKKHFDSIVDIDIQEMIHLTKAIQQIVKDNGLVEEGFRLVNNCGKHGQQTVNHIHFHILGKRQLSWPPR